MRFLTFIFILVYANLSSALGLGDIELKSHLGEKLFAKINVTDIEATTEASCFSVVDVSDAPAFKSANITFKQVNDNHQLYISTNDVITEPIVNLRVSAHCEPNINRDYVLLLDPAPLASVESESSDIADQAKIPFKKQDKRVTNRRLAEKKTLADNLVDESISPASTAAAVEPVLTKAAKKSAKSKKTSNKISSIDEKLMEAYTGKPQATPPAVDKKIQGSISEKPMTAQAATDKPYLVISGGNEKSADNANKPSLSLRLETQLDLARAPSAETPIGAEDAIDEATVMTNRLAHLEKQIISLQTRNSQLVSNAEKAKNEGFSFDVLHSSWLQYLLMALGAIGTIAFIEWLRRKQLSKRLDQEKANWYDHDSMDEDLEVAQLNSKNNALLAEAAKLNRINVTSSSNQDNSTIFDNKAEITDESDEENESILDNAEVFIAHGRPMLAIQLLGNYLSDFPTESPAIWLKLLDLLSKEGSASEYDAAVLVCKQFFNIKMPTFTDTTIADTSSIEDYPQIIARLEGVWGSPFAVGFLSDLIYNQKSQPREGFERNTFEELFFLKEIAVNLNPNNDSEHEHSFYHPDVVNPMLGKVALNEAMFADIAPFDEMESPPYNTSSNNPTETEPLLNTDEASAITASATTSSNQADIAGSYIIESNNTVNITDEAKPTDAFDTLLNSEKTPSIDDGMHHVNGNFLSNAPSADVSGAFNIDEINFSATDYQIDFETVPEINLHDEITLGSDSFVVQEEDGNLESDLFKTKLAKKSNVKKPAQENVIEWDLPTNLDEDSLK